MVVSEKKEILNNTQFVVYLENEGLQKCITSSAEHAGAIVFKSFSKSLLKRLFRLHNTWRLNRKLELPLKSLWYRRCLDESKLDKTKDIYFIFYESFYMTYSRKYLRHLKKNFPNSKFCYVFLNPINQAKIEKYNTVKKYYDAGVAIFQEDAQKYGMLLNEYYCYQPPQVKTNPVYQSDIFFVGVNKGRLPRLLEVYEKLTSAGINCDFHITEVDEQDQKYSDKIVYNKRMSYEEAMERMVGTKCALEVIQDNDYYFSIRTVEALQFHKKLLTTNKSITKYSFYDPSVIQVFDKAEEIKTEFILSQISEEAFPNQQLWSFERFEEYLVEHLTK